MRATLGLLLALSILMCSKFSSCFAQERANSEISPAQLQDALNSTNGAVRFRLAEKLSLYHSEATFSALLKLLTDKNVDISYAAAESIEARKDNAFDRQLIATIETLPRNNRWPSYRAAKNYSTQGMLIFLQQRLDEEIEFQHKRNAFDSENCFYLAQSLEQIARNLQMPVKLAAPEGDSLVAYEAFAKQFKNLQK